MLSKALLGAAVAACVPGAFGFAPSGVSMMKTRSLTLRGPRMAGEKVHACSWRKDLFSQGVPRAGERKITKVGDQDVMVVNHKGTVYALSPKCPHLGLPMKTVIFQPLLALSTDA
eukprot:758080-Hanusia_phi.AAC.1